MSVRKLFHPVPLSELKAAAAPDEWLVDLVVAKGSKTLFTGRSKDAGKTTFWMHLLKVMKTGGSFCDLKVAPARVVWISEGPRGAGQIGATGWAWRILTTSTACRSPRASRVWLPGKPILLRSPATAKRSAWTWWSGTRSPTCRPSGTRTTIPKWPPP